MKSRMNNHDRTNLALELILGFLIMILSSCASESPQTHARRSSALMWLNNQWAPQQAAAPAQQQQQQQQNNIPPNCYRVDASRIACN